MTDALVQTWQYATKTEVNNELASNDGLTDRAAITIARWWERRNQGDAPALYKLAHGLRFDTDDALDEAARIITDPDQCDALSDWLSHLEDLLTDPS